MLSRIRNHIEKLPRTPIWLTIILATVLILSWKIVPLVWNLPKQQVQEFQNSLPLKERLSPKEELELINKYQDTLFKNILSVVSTIATISGGVVLYLNFRVANRNVEIANKNAELAIKNAKLAEDRLISDRFSKAIEQLGEKSIHIRLGGIYSLEQIAYDSPSDYWTVIEVLTAYIREKSPLQIGPKPSTAPIEDEFIKIDIQAAITVIGRCHPEDKENRQQEKKNQKINLSKSYLVGAYLMDADLSNVNLYKSDLRKSYLVKANLTSSNLSKADFRWANLIGTKFHQAALRETDLSNTNDRLAVGIARD